MPSSSPDFLQPQGITVHVHGVAESVSNEVDDLFKLLTEVELPPWVTSGWYPHVDKDCYHVLQSLANHYVLKDSEDSNASAPAIPHQFFDLIPLLARAVHETQRSYAKSSQGLSLRTGNERNLLSFLTRVFLVLFPRDSIKSDAQYATCIDVCCSNSPLSLLLRRGDTVDLVIAYKVPSVHSSPDLEVVPTRASDDDDDGSGSSPLATSSQDSGASSQYNLPSPMSMSEWLADPNTRSDDSSSTDFYLVDDRDIDEPADESLLKSFFLDDSAGEIPALCVAPCRKIYSVLASALLARRECGICSPLVGLAFGDASLNVFVVIGWILESNLGCPEIHVRHAPSDGPLSIDCGAFSLLNPAESLRLTLALDRLAREVLQPASVLEAQHSQLDATRLGELRRRCWRIDVARPERSRGWTSRDLEAWARGVVLDEADLSTHSLPCVTDPAGIEHSTADLSIMPPKSNSRGGKGTSKDGTASSLTSIPEEVKLPVPLSFSKFARDREKNDQSQIESHWRSHISQLESIVMTHTLAPPWAQAEDRVVENEFPVPLGQYNELAGRMSSQDFTKIHEEMKKDYANYSMLPAKVILDLEDQLVARDTPDGQFFTLRRNSDLEDSEIRLIASTLLLVLNQLETRRVLGIDTSTISSSPLEIEARRIWDQVHEISFREISEKPTLDIDSPDEKAKYSTSEHAQADLRGLRIQALPERTMQLPRNIFFDRIFQKHMQLRYDESRDLLLSQAATNFCHAVTQHFREGAEKEQKAAANTYNRAVRCFLLGRPEEKTELDKFDRDLKAIIDVTKSGKRATINPKYAASSPEFKTMPNDLRFEYSAAFMSFKATSLHVHEIQNLTEDWERSTNDDEKDLGTIAVARASFQPISGRPDFSVSIYFDDHRASKELVNQFNATPYQPMLSPLNTDPAVAMEGDLRQQLGSISTSSAMEDDIFASRQLDERRARELAMELATATSHRAAGTNLREKTELTPQLRSEPEPELAPGPKAEPAAATKILPQDVASSDIPAPPEHPPGVGFAAVVVEHKREKGEAQRGSTQLRLCQHSPVIQLSSIGIYDFPVFGVFTEGHTGVLTCMWAEKGGLHVGNDQYDIVHSAERHCLSFELSSALGILDYVTFLSLVRTRHIPLLSKRFAEAMERQTEARGAESGPHFTSNWKMESQRESMIALLKQLQIKHEDIQSYSTVMKPPKQNVRRKN